MRIDKEIANDDAIEGIQVNNNAWPKAWEEEEEWLDEESEHKSVQSTNS